MKACNEKFLDLLGEKYPSVQAATSEIINLEAILRLPKGTEHFVSDLHAKRCWLQWILMILTIYFVNMGSLRSNKLWQINLISNVLIY